MKTLEETPGRSRPRSPRRLAAAGALAGLLLGAPAGAVMDLSVTLSDGAQRNTIAFDGFAFVTGNLASSSFFPPGKVADYWGFQYLRDNTPDGNGHNTSFLTNIAYNVLDLLDDAQFAMLADLAGQQVDEINLYGWKRFPLMRAFERQLDGDLPGPGRDLDLAAVKDASAELYRLDGAISFERAVVYADLYRTLTLAQDAALGALAAGGFASWSVSAEMEARVKERTRGFGHDKAVAVMTYAGDLFSWYEGSLAADVYFAPERQGTYFGSFYMKDAPAIGHPGYVIDTELTANAGKTFLDELATTGLDVPVKALVAAQRADLATGSPSIVGARTEISTALRSLMGPVAPSAQALASVATTVDQWSDTYGRLDGGIVWSYATTFATVRAAMTAGQFTNMMALRTQILSGTYGGEPFDFTVATNPYLYSAGISDASLLVPWTGDTDWLFLPDGDEDGRIDDEDPCTTFAATSPPTSPPDQSAAKFKLALTGLALPAGSQGLSLEGFFNPATSSSVPDPAVVGVRIRVADASGTIFDLDVPGGLAGTSPCGLRDGWHRSSTATATTWRWSSSSGGLPDGAGGCIAGGARGLASILVKDATDTRTGAWQFKAVARRASLSALPASPRTRIEAQFVLGAREGITASDASIAGQCAEAVFEGSPISSSTPAPWCRQTPTTGTASSVRCAGP